MSCILFFYLNKLLLNKIQLFTILNFPDAYTTSLNYYWSCNLQPSKYSSLGFVPFANTSGIWARSNGRSFINFESSLHVASVFNVTSCYTTQRRIVSLSHNITLIRMQRKFHNFKNAITPIASSNYIYGYKLWFGENV